MGRIKDFFYNRSDIFLAILILALAAFVIYMKVDTIMGYTGKNTDSQPHKKSVAEQGEENTENTYQIQSENNNNSDYNNENNRVGKNTDHKDKTEKETIKCSIYIPYGATSQQIAASVVATGLMKTEQEFFDVLARSGSAGKIQSGNFIIPMDATDEEVIQYITGVKK